MAKVWIIGGNQGIGEVIREELRQHSSVLSTSELDADVRSSRDLQRTYLNFTPDHIVYVAGINKLMPATKFNEFDALDIMDVNVLGFMRVIKIVAANPGITQSIVAISSDAGTRPMRNSMAYCASKAALNMAVRCAARELAPGVQINAVAPGVVADTPHTDAVDEQVERIKGWPKGGAEAADQANTPMGRRASKQEIAEVVALLLNAPAYLTGEIVLVNGGK
jgi:NAD(P)-dependent dehydrogenase (short-subunit alcohol dehydrogenase family)